MRWEDERYVRVYTRDTADWLALGWEAQALFVLTLRKVDRAGLLELGRAGSRGLAAVVGMPFEVIERALPVLLADGCFGLSGTTLVCPNFIEAQEAAQTDAQRKRESRARARDRAAVHTLPGLEVTKTDNGATKSDAEVTKTDAPPQLTSQLVTPNCAVPSRAVEDPAPKNGVHHKQRRQRPDDDAIEALRADFETQYFEVMHEKLDWRGSDYGDLGAIRKSLGEDDAEAKRRWGLFLKDTYWPIKIVHKFRDAYTHPKYKKPPPTSPWPPGIPHAES